MNDFDTDRANPVSSGEDSARNRAWRQARAERRFYRNLMSYIVTISGLAILNYVTSPDAWWFYWAAIGWGIGLAFQFMAVFVTRGCFGQDWEERRIRQILERKGQ